jgi:hypothetical protein
MPLTEYTFTNILTEGGGGWPGERWVVKGWAGGGERLGGLTYFIGERGEREEGRVKGTKAWDGFFVHSL